MSARTIVRRVVYGLLGALVVLVNLAAAAILYLDSDRARERLVEYLVELAPKGVPGGVSIGSSSGHLLSTVVLYDGVLRDREGRPAIIARRIEARLAWRSLLRRRVEFTRVAAEGVVVLLQPSREGPVNLAILGRAHKKPSHGPMAVSLRFSGVEVDTRLLWRPHQGQLGHDLHGIVRGVLEVSRDRVVSLSGVGVDFSYPTRAALSMAGSVHIRHKEVEAREATVWLAGDTTPLRRYAGEIELSGPAAIVLHADGDRDAMRASLAAQVTHPAAVVEAAARLERDQVTVDRLRLRSPSTDAWAKGSYRFDQTGKVAAHVDARELRALAGFGLPVMHGSATVDAAASRTKAHTEVAVEGTIDDLRLGNGHLAHGKLDVHLRDLKGTARLEGTSLVLGRVVLRTVGIDLAGTPTRISALALARGAEGIAIDLALDGAPRVVHRRLVGFDGALAKLRIRAGGHPFVLTRPAPLHADFEQQAYALDDFALASDAQRLLFHGRVRAGTVEEAALQVQHFDLSQLPGLLAPGHLLPHTDLDVTANVVGPLSEPTAHLAFHGRADGRTNNDLIHVSTVGSAALAHRRLSGKVFAKIAGQKTSAKFDVPFPLRPGQPLDVSFDAAVRLSPTFSQLLVPKFFQSVPIVMYSLGTKVLVQGSVTGTTSDPHLNLGARLRNWGAADGHGGAGLSLEYARGRLSASATVTLSRLPAGGGKGGGVVQATAVLPVDLSTVTTGRSAPRLDATAPWHAQVKLEHVHIEHLPWKAFAIVPMTTRGWVDASVALAGSRRHPKATVELDAHGLSFRELDDTELHARASLDDRRASATWNVSLRGAEMMHGHGSIDATHADWRRAPLTATAVSAAFDLAHLGMVERLEGTLRAEVTVTGSLADPAFAGHLRVAPLRLGAVTYDDARIDAAEGRLEVSLHETRGGALHGRLKVEDGRLDGALTAKAFPFDLESELLPRLRALIGQLDGDVAIGGSTRAPTLTGSVDVRRGQLRLATTAVTYRDAELSLRLLGRRGEVTRLATKAGSHGDLIGRGTFTLAGRSVVRADGRLQLRKCPLVWDTLTGLADLDLAVHARRTGEHELDAEVGVEHGLIELVGDRDARKLLPIAHLEDVRVAPARPAPVFPQLVSPPEWRRSLSLSVKGPITIRSDGFDLPAQADLRFELVSERPLITGALTLAPRTRVKVFDQPYEVERGRFVFARSTEPTLDISLTRADGGHRIGVILDGPAHQPRARFWATPSDLSIPLIASRVTGQPASAEGVAMKGLEHKAKGALSQYIWLSLSQSAPNEPYSHFGPSSKDK